MDNKKTEIFINRMISRMNELGLTKSELARRANTSPAAINNYSRGRYFPKEKNIQALARALDVSPEWLRGEVDDLQPEFKQEGADVPSSVVRIPLFDQAALFDDDAEPDTWELIPRAWLEGGGRFFALRVNDRSMSPRIPPETVCYLQRCSNWHDNRIMGVCIGGRIALRLVKVGKGVIVLVPFNSDCEIEMYTVKEVKELGIKPLGLLIQSRFLWTEEK